MDLENNIINTHITYSTYIPPRQTKQKWIRKPIFTYQFHPINYAELHFSWHFDLTFRYPFLILAPISLSLILGTLYTVIFRVTKHFNSAKISHSHGSRNVKEKMCRRYLGLQTFLVQIVQTNKPVLKMSRSQQLSSIDMNSTIVCDYISIRFGLWNTVWLYISISFGFRWIVESGHLWSMKDEV